MTTRPHDALFRSAFEDPNPGGALLRAVLPPEVNQVIAWSTLRGEPGSYIDDDLGDRYSDLLFSARLGDETLYVYLLIEHMSSNDRLLPLRMLEYITRIVRRVLKLHPETPVPPEGSPHFSRLRPSITA